MQSIFAKCCAPQDYEVIQDAPPPQKNFQLDVTYDSKTIKVTVKNGTASDVKLEAAKAVGKESSKVEVWKAGSPDEELSEEDTVAPHDAIFIKVKPDVEEV